MPSSRPAPSVLARARRAVVPTEHDEQVALVRWSELATGRYPELAWLMAIPNGGHRAKAVAAKLKAEGVRAGYPDLGLDCQRHGFAGLRIEMKRRDATPSDVKPAQREWHQWLTSAGYCVRVCRGWEEARAVLEWYLTP